MALTCFRHFCASSRVLDVYLNGAAPIAEHGKLYRQLQDAVALSLRTQSVDKPDHQHRYHQASVFDECKTLSDTLLTALGVADSCATHGLEFRHGKIYVCSECLEEWQQEVTAYQSPVPILAAAWVAQWHREHRAIETAIPELCASLSHSCLPGVHDPRLHRLIHDENDNAGRLCDLHVHINGSTEFTQVWLHSLLNISETYKAICNAYRASPQGGRTQFFLKQLRMTPEIIERRLYTAAVIRRNLCGYLETCSSGHAFARALSPRDVHKLICNTECNENLPPHHPFGHACIPEPATQMQREGAMWVYALHVLNITRDHTLALLMHMYLLLMHQHLRLLVQQPEQYGFDQFQYITLAGAREDAEKPRSPGFSSRFLQFQGMYGPDMAYVEARFAPKATPEATQRFITCIWDDYHTATGQDCTRVRPCAACPRLTEMYHIHNGQMELYKSELRTQQPKPFVLGLVAHFIKVADGSNGYRHHDLRNTLNRQASALIACKKELMHSRPALARALVGKDAASNELDAPPEVFAPIFRQLNRAGITHTTYHAGEDFEHILCGIRAVHEAVTFLEMGSGDRIGHATALGLNPALCECETVYCRKGQWLDTLIWLTKLLDSVQPLLQFAGEAFIAHSNITTLYREIYKADCPDLPVLWKAWEFRRFSPTIFADDKEAISPDLKADRRVLLEMQHTTGDTLCNLARSEFEKYHKRENIQRWNIPMVLKKEQHPSLSLVLAVQDFVIAELCRKNIAVEVLPTSNVRISHYHRTDEHHVMRWLCPNDARPAPQVVLGTDDPGIFSTSLRNEYTFILKKLQNLHPGDSEKPYEIIRHLIENGKSYRFAKNSPMSN